MVDSHIKFEHNMDIICIDETSIHTVNKTDFYEFMS